MEHTNKRVFTWNAAPARLLGEKEHGAGLPRFAKLGTYNVIVSDRNEIVTVLTHDSTSSFQFLRRLLNSHSEYACRATSVGGGTWLIQLNESTGIIVGPDQTGQWATPGTV